MNNAIIRSSQNHSSKVAEKSGFAKGEGTETRQSISEKVSFGALSLDTRGYKFNRDEANERQYPSGHLYSKAIMPMSRGPLEKIS